MERRHWVLSLIISFVRFAWSVTLLCYTMYVGYMTMHQNFFCFVLYWACIYECMKFDFFVLIWILILFFLKKKCIYECMKLWFFFCFNMNFDFWTNAYMNARNFVNFLNESACLNALILFVFFHIIFLRMHL